MEDLAHTADQLYCWQRADTMQTRLQDLARSKIILMTTRGSDMGTIDETNRNLETKRSRATTRTRASRWLHGQPWLRSCEHARYADVGSAVTAERLTARDAKADAEATPDAGAG